MARRALRDLDDAVAADPRRFVPHAVAVAGLLYAGAGSVLWLASVLGFTEDGSERLQAVLLCPWSALPLALVLRGATPRPVGLLVAVAAAGQYALAAGSWGLELAYAPVALAGLLLLLVGRAGRP